INFAGNETLHRGEDATLIKDRGCVDEGGFVRLEAGEKRLKHAARLRPLLQRHWRPMFLLRSANGHPAQMVWKQCQASRTMLADVSVHVVLPLRFVPFFH